MLVRLGAFTIRYTCVPDSAITEAAEVSIVPVVGPEVVTGSTRLKAGTAQKLVLNMISTAALEKLVTFPAIGCRTCERGILSCTHGRLRILMAETGVDEDDGDSRRSKRLRRNECSVEDHQAEVESIGYRGVPPWRPSSRCPFEAPISLSLGKLDGLPYKS